MIFLETRRRSDLNVSLVSTLSGKDLNDATTKQTLKMHYEIFTTLGRKNSEFDPKPLKTIEKI